MKKVIPVNFHHKIGKKKSYYHFIEMCVFFIRSPHISTTLPYHEHKRYFEPFLERPIFFALSLSVSVSSLNIQVSFFLK